MGRNDKFSSSYTRFTLKLSYQNPEENAELLFLLFLTDFKTNSFSNLQN